MKEIRQKEYFSEIIDDCVKGLKKALETGDRNKGWKAYHRMRSVLYIAFPEEDEEGLPTIK